MKIQLGDRRIPTEYGKRLSEVLQEHGVFSEQPCGGRGTCGKCKVLADGEEVLACQYVVTKDVTVEVQSPIGIDVFTCVEERNTEWEYTDEDALALALDIGSTTLELALVSTADGRIVANTNATNPQVAYGADVMTRIEYAMRQGVEKLQEVLLEKIREMAESLFEHANMTEGTVSKLYVAGNTTMLHCFFGVDPSPMGTYPYEAAFLESRRVSGASMGISFVKEIISIPCISAFVGADLVAGVHYVGMPSDGKYRLLVDLGTNAEVVLFSKEKIVCTSAAAGPCFEGANISCGMPAVAGAVARFALDGENKVKPETIDDAPPIGICGTGLIDIVAELVRCGIIDEEGYMRCGSYEVAEGIFLNQQDVRQFQLAKSAVYSAIVVLMKRLQISFDEIECVYISGGFSAKINVFNGVRVGLLPKELENKCVAIHNSSLQGTVRYACEEANLTPYLDNATYVDLSMDSEFTDLFIENMGFM